MNRSRYRTRYRNTLAAGTPFAQNSYWIARPWSWNCWRNGLRDSAGIADSCSSYLRNSASTKRSFGWLAIHNVFHRANTPKPSQRRCCFDIAGARTTCCPSRRKSVSYLTPNALGRLVPRDACLSLGHDYAVELTSCAEVSALDSSRAYSRRSVNGPSLHVTRTPNNVSDTFPSRFHVSLCSRNVTVASGTAD